MRLFKNNTNESCWRQTKSRGEALDDEKQWATYALITASSILAAAFAHRAAIQTAAANEARKTAKTSWEVIKVLSVQHKSELERFGGSLLNYFRSWSIHEKAQ